jgi:hypothetical protein
MKAHYLLDERTFPLESSRGGPGRGNSEIVEYRAKTDQKETRQCR